MATFWLMASSCPQWSTSDYSSLTNTSLINGVLCQSIAWSQVRLSGEMQCFNPDLPKSQYHITWSLDMSKLVSVALFMANIIQMRFFIKKSEPNKSY